MDRIWRVIFPIVFQCARIVFTITRLRLRGALVAIWSEGRILLIQKSYRAAWSIPGGLVRRRETRKQGAVREAFEEVGVSLDMADLTFIAEVPGELGPNDWAYLYEVETHSPVKVTIDGREIVRAEFVAPQKAMERLLDKQIEGYIRACAHECK